MKDRKARTWRVVLLGYVGLIYATLAFAPGIWNEINNFSKGHGIILIYVAGLAAVTYAFFHMLFLKKQALFRRGFLFFAGLGIFYFLNGMALLPAEKIHIIEYGCLSFLFFRAFWRSMKHEKLKFYLTAFSCCLAVGVMDEVIQKILPGRVFEWKDIFLNGTASAAAYLIMGQ